MLRVLGEENPGSGWDVTGGLGLGNGFVLIGFVSVVLVVDEDEVEGTVLLRVHTHYHMRVCIGGVVFG